MSLADGDRQEQVIHKEVIIDMNNNSEMKWNENFSSSKKIEAFQPDIFIKNLPSQITSLGLLARKCSGVKNFILVS